MSIGIRLPRLLALLTCVIAGCASAPHGADYTGQPNRFNPSKDPYWEDPRWDKRLLDSAQAAAHDPVDASDMSNPGLHAVVRFTYLGGVIEYPEILQSTGDTEKDKLLLHQLASAQPPQASGIDSDKPHEFVLDLDMPTPYESLEYGIFDAFDSWKIYPKEAILGSRQGMTTVNFDYQDGKAVNVAMQKSSGANVLDKASLGTVSKAVLPMPAADYTGKTLHMEVSFCYALYRSPNEKQRCPTARNVILVTGTLIRQVTM